MKCQKCGANNANTHVKTVVNGEFREYDLCSDCAHKMGYTTMFSDMDNEFSGLLGSFFNNVLPARTQATRCEFCGSSYPEIAKTGMVGCAHCYELFADRLYPSIRRIHGNTTHCGKNSAAAKEKRRQTERIFEAAEHVVQALGQLQGGGTETKVSDQQDEITNNK